MSLLVSCIVEGVPERNCTVNKYMVDDWTAERVIIGSDEGETRLFISNANIKNLFSKQKSTSICFHYPYLYPFFINV